MGGMYLIVGALGFIGNKLYDYFKSDGLDVKGTYCSQTFEGAERDGIHLDLNNPDFSHIFGLKNLTHIFLCHGVTNIDQCKTNNNSAYIINVANTIGMLRGFVHTDVVPIYLSTDMVYDGTKKDFSESDELAPSTEYGKQKVEVENYIITNFSRYIILRLTKVYGVERGDGTLFTSWLDSLMRHKTIPCADDVFISPLYVMDVVGALEELIDGEHYGIFNLGGIETATWYDFALRLAKYFKCDLSLVEKKSIGDFKFVEQRPLYSSLNSSAIRETIELRLTPLRVCFKMIDQSCGAMAD